MKVAELIEELQKIESEQPGLDVGFYNAEFMVCETIVHAEAKEEIYVDREGPDVKKVVVTLY